MIIEIEIIPFPNEKWCMLPYMFWGVMPLLVICHWVTERARSNYNLCGALLVKLYIKVKAMFTVCIGCHSMLVVSNIFMQVSRFISDPASWRAAVQTVTVNGSQYTSLLCSKHLTYYIGHQLLNFSEAAFIMFFTVISPRHFSSMYKHFLMRILHPS